MAFTIILYSCFYFVQMKTNAHWGSIYVPTVEYVSTMLVLMGVTVLGQATKEQHVPEVNEPRRQKTNFRCFLPGPTQTDLYSHNRKQES